MKEKAKAFAIKAHIGQVRKNEPEKPMIIHPIEVGEILEFYGYDDSVVAAGYLHDVVEDTKYTIEDIEKKFGTKIKNFVDTASEDKSKTWEERKQHTIDLTKTLPLENKLIICADKISNIEDLIIKIGKTGCRDFSAFKRGEEKQRWYYENIYKSLIYNEEELEIFKRLKEDIDILFYNKEDSILNEIFFENKELLEKLKKINFKKQELFKLKKIVKLNKPYVIEFCGTPRTGKTSIINNFYDFFKKGGFKIKLLEELTTSDYYKRHLLPKMDDMDLEEVNEFIIKETEKQLMETLNEDNDIIMIDRSINDRMIWNYRRYKRKDMSKEKYEELKKHYSNFSKDNINTLIVLYTDSITSLKRDYLNSLALEKRNFLNLENIDEYNLCMECSKTVFENSVDKVIKMDTTNINQMDSALIIIDQILDDVRKKYIEELNIEFN